MPKKRTKQYVKPKDQLVKEQEQAREHTKNLENQKKHNEQKTKLVLYGGIILLISILAVIGISAYNNRYQPGRWDSFAQCLSEQDAVMYGNMYSCKYSQHQAGMFGKSFKYINYKDASENPDVTITPTWYINNEKLDGEQSFETLSAKTGCSLY